MTKTLRDVLVRAERWPDWAQEALAGHFAVMRADGDPVPPPRSFEDLQRDPDFREDSAGAIVTMVTPQQAMAAE